MQQFQCASLSAQVLSKASSPTIGGRDLDLKLLLHFAEEFKKKYRIDTLSHAKRVLRLMTEVEKVKKTMSTVTTPVPLNLECFAEDRDVSSSIKRQVLRVIVISIFLIFNLGLREVFDELCSALYSQLTATLQSALDKSSKLFSFCLSRMTPKTGVFFVRVERGGYRGSGGDWGELSGACS